MDTPNKVGRRSQSTRGGARQTALRGADNLLVLGTFLGVHLAPAESCGTLEATQAGWAAAGPGPAPPDCARQWTRPVTGDIFSLNEFLIGVTFSPTGQMYAWSQKPGGSGIYRINTATGAASVVTSLAATGGEIFGMTVGPGGSLYASTGSALLRL